MNECEVCANADNEYCFACDNGDQFKPITNAKRIRRMSDEELAECLYRWDNSPLRASKERWLNWLTSPVEEGKT